MHLSHFPDSPVEVISAVLLLIIAVLPRSIGNARCHGGSDAKRLLDADEVVEARAARWANAAAAIAAFKPKKLTKA
jgi:hypothetical protein